MIPITNASSLLIQFLIIKTWLKSGFRVMPLVFQNLLDFPRMNTDWPRMDTDKLNFEHIREIRSARRVPYPCPSVANPCSSVENLTPRHVEDAVDRCPLAPSQDHPKIQYEAKTFAIVLSIIFQRKMIYR